MKELYTTLTELQTVLARMFEIEDQIDDIPKALADKEAVLEKTKLTYLDYHTKSEKAKEELRSFRAQLDEAGKKREASEKMMETITLSREFDILTKEIEEAKNLEQTLTKNLASKDKYISELQDKLNIQEEIMEHETKEVEEETQRKDALIAEKQAELKQILEQKEKLSEGMEPTLLFKFERIIRNKSGLGIVPIHGIVCEGCHMTLPAQFVNDVRKEEEINFCPYCSRVLYFEESADGDEQFDIAMASDDSEDKDDSDDDSMGGLGDLSNSDDFSDF